MSYNKRGVPGQSYPWRNPSNRNTRNTGNTVPVNSFKNFKINQDDDRCTHFISIPFNDEELVTSFNAFRSDLLDNFGVNGNIIQKTEKLHKTILNLKLNDGMDINKAKEVLENEKNSLKKILEENTKRKHVEIRGLKEPPNLMSTLYLFSNVDSEVIPRIQNHLMEAFRRANVEVITNAQSKPPRTDQIVVVSKNLLIPENTEEIDYSFNPGPIFRKYRNHEFGKFDIEEIHLSRRYVSGDDGYDGYYKNEMVLNF